MQLKGHVEWGDKLSWFRWDSQNVGLAVVKPGGYWANLDKLVTLNWRANLNLSGSNGVPRRAGFPWS